jgi:hypothetical protein
MRILASALVATVALGAYGTALAGGAGKRPTLQILALTPLTVRGASFRPGERVTLLVNAGKPLTKRLAAGPRGGFTVRLHVVVEGCTAVVVQAIGARGSRAMSDLPMPGCREQPQ